MSTDTCPRTLGAHTCSLLSSSRGLRMSQVLPEALYTSSGLGISGGNH